MRQRLLWKLLVGHIVPVFAVFALLIWHAIDRRAADYLKELEVHFHVSPVGLHRQFLEAVHHNLFWGVLIALAVTLLFTYLFSSCTPSAAADHRHHQKGSRRQLF